MANNYDQRLSNVKTVSEVHLMVNLLTVLDCIWVALDAWSWVSWYEVCYLLATACNIAAAISGLCIGTHKVHPESWSIGTIVGLGMLCLTVITDILAVLTMLGDGYPINMASNAVRIILLILLNGTTFYGVHLMGKVVAHQHPPRNDYSRWAHNAAGVPINCARVPRVV